MRYGAIISTRIEPNAEALMILASAGNDRHTDGEGVWCGETRAEDSTTDEWQLRSEWCCPPPHNEQGIQPSKHDR